MNHIGYAVLKDGKPTGEMRALCGATTTAVLPPGARSSSVCPACAALNSK